MKKNIQTIICAIFILAFYSSLYPQNFEWEQTNGLFGGIVYRIEITPAGEIYAAAGATLFRSGDNAQTWAKVNFEWADGSSFISNSSGDILADSGMVIKKSTDKGATWFKVADVGGRINDLSRSTENYLFAAADSVIYRSTDGGDNWTILYKFPAGTQITSISTTNDSVYYVTAFDKIYRSNDGGFSWTNANGNLNDLLFGKIATDKNGQVFVSSVSVIHTSTDNGNTWTTAYDGETHWALVPVVDSKGNVWVSTGDNLLKRVNEEWVNAAHFESYNEHFVIKFDKDGNIYAGTHSGILKSSDDGATWTMQNEGLQAETIFNMERGAGNKIFAHKTYEVCFTTDRGNSWERLNTGMPKSGTDKISVYANGKGMVVYTEDNNILVSTDNGNRWVYPNTISSDRILGVAIDPDNNIYALSYNRIFFSDNYGINWEERYLWEHEYYWPKIIAADDGNLFVLRGEGIYKSVDNGISWIKITANENNNVYYEDFIITHKGIIIAGKSDGVIRLTRDGELLGTLADPDKTSNLNSIVYEAQNGTIYLNTYYNLYSSTDEGITWEVLKEINLWNPDRCYITDDNGFLYAGNSRSVRKSSVPVLKITPPVPAAKPGDQKVYLSWNKNTSPEFKEYKIYGGSEAYPDSVIYTGTGINDTTAVITNLNNDIPWYFVVSAEDNNGNESFSSSLKVTPIPLPAAPGLLSPANGEINLPNEFTLTWQTVPFAKTYTIQFYTDSTLSYFAFQFAGLPFPSTESPILKSGTKYFWRVASVNPAGASSFSSFWNFTTQLEAPELTAETEGIEKNKLTWVNKSNISPGFIIERKADNEAGFTLLDTITSGITTYKDSKAVSATTYKYRIKAYTAFAVSGYSNEVTVQTITDVNENTPVPTEYAVKQNYPNPFNPSTMIEYSLPYESNVKIVIYNSLGEAVSELADGIKSAGMYNVSFNAATLSSGIYFCSIKAESIDGKNKFNSIKKMMLVK